MSSDRGQVVIRLAGSADMASICDLMNKQILGGRAHFGVTPDVPETYETQWREQGETYPWLIAADADGSFLGFAKAGRWKAREAYDWTVEVSVYLVEAARGRGIGRLLYDRLFETLAAQGFVVAIGGMTLPNPASERLHESMGMTRAGEFTPNGFKFGRWMPVRYYQMMLRDLGVEDDPGSLRGVSEVWTS
ncbi:MAG: N-acetyltransferase family protein [Planctomycetota bacterium]